MSKLQRKPNSIIQDKEYLEWIAELSKRFMQSQVKAAVRVNQEMLRFYWSLGRDITDRQFDNKYGSHFYENLSRDLVATLGIKKGFSPSTLYYTKYFYQLYSPLFENFQQPAEKLDNVIYQQPADDSASAIFQQPVEDFELLFAIPWPHHQKIIDKVQGNSKKAMFFVRKTWESYALSRINAPIGISEYELAKQQLPKEMQTALPTVEEIQNELNKQQIKP